MKKISSFVLMAVMLLMSANTWATIYNVGSSDEFQNKWAAAASGDKIVLTGDVTLSKTMWLGTKNLTDSPRSLEIDLNGNELISSASYAFMLTHGSLTISNSKATEGGQLTFSGKNGFYITGSTNKDVDPSKDGVTYFTHLVIEEGVYIVHTYYDAAITIDDVRKDCPAQKENTNFIPSKPALGYICNVFANKETESNKGVANGVRVDFKGKINGKKYGIKTNGTLGSPTWYFENYKKPDSTVYFSSTLLPTGYKIHPSDTKYAPFVYVYPKSKIQVLADNPDGSGKKNPIGIYASGYARWKVEGYSEGGVGACVKSGEVDFHDATVVGTGSSYAGATATNSGTTASGSAIVIESSGAYVGDIEVSVSGESTVTATNGYAIDEAVTTQDEETKVDAISITGGSFQGGTIGKDEEGNDVQGTIKITETTVESGPNTVTVTGGDVQGTGEDNVNIGGLSLEEFLSDQTGAGTETYIEYVQTETGTVMVITAGAEPDEYEIVSNAPENESVVWKWASPSKTTPMTGTISDDLTLAKLVINQDYKQTLTIAEGKTLTVGRVILGAKAQIVVEAGGRFIVSGEQGITAKTSDNIVLKTSATNQALFLVNPSVETNKHPKAQVEMTSKGYYDSEKDKYMYQRFGVPSFETSVTFSDIVKSEPSAFMKLVSDAWVEVDYANWGTEKLVPFTTYAVTAANAGAVYTFNCNLVGNSNTTLPLTGKWNYYANSYTAPISIAEIIEDYINKYTNVSATIYLHDLKTNLWHPVNKSTVHSHPEYASVIKPMHAFIIQRRAAGSNPVINYKDEVYTPTLASLSAAPARAMAPSFATAVIEIAAADGTKDEVSLLEGEQFSAGFDNAYDATKLMNSEHTYIYADGVDEKFGIIATDNLEGTTLSLDAKEQTSFIMTVRNADGMNYAIRDMLTGTEVELTEGATYMFSVPANTTVNGRFKVVGLHKVPTAIESIEEVAATKGIYNMAGQYMGNDFYSLSAGVYVVNGKKVVK